MPPVTGEEPASGFLGRLAEMDGTADGAATAATGLAAARAALARIDAGGLGADPAAYDEVAAALEPLASGGLDPRRSLVAELVKPGRPRGAGAGGRQRGRAGDRRPRDAAAGAALRRR